MKRLITIVATVVVALTIGLAGPAAARAKAPPASCVKALDAADELRTEASTLLSGVAGFFQNLHDNAVANSGDQILFIERLTTDTQTLGSSFDATETAKVRSTITRLGTYGARCRAGH